MIPRQVSRVIVLQTDRIWGLARLSTISLMVVLSSLAGSLGGEAYRAEPSTIRKLYELISQNF